MKRIGISLLTITTICGSVEAAQAPNQKIGSFTIIKTTDAMDDSVMIRAVTESSASGRKASLEWRCQRDTAVVVYGFNDYLRSSERGRVIVKYRIDQNPPSSTTVWDLGQASGRDAYVMGQFSTGVETIKELTTAAVQGTKILIEVSSDGKAIRDTFSISGLPEVLKKLDCMQKQGIVDVPQVQGGIETEEQPSFNPADALL